RMQLSFFRQSLWRRPGSSRWLALPRLACTALVLSLVPQGNARVDAAIRSPAPSAIDFRYPQRGYTVRRLGSITAYVENQLLTENAAAAEKALVRLEENARLALALLPDDYRAELREIPFYILYGPKSRGGGHTNGLEYFASWSPDYSA